MDDSWGKVLIGCLCTIVGALIARYGVWFPNWLRGVKRLVSNAEGHSENRWNIDPKRDTFRDTNFKATYDLKNGRLKWIGDYASVAADVKITRPERSGNPSLSLPPADVTTQGKLKGKGPVVNGWAYLRYRVVEQTEQGSWSFTGLCVLQMLESGPELHGYWISQNLLENEQKGAVLAVGHILVKCPGA